MRQPHFLILSLFLLASYILPGQNAPSLQVGLGLMATSYFGDLTSGNTAFSRLAPGGSLWLKFGSQGALRPMVQVGLGSFTDQLDEGSFEPVPDVDPTEFVRTSFFFIDFRLTYHFLKDKTIHPYLIAGLGPLFFSPKDEDGNFLGENAFTRLPGETYATTVFSFPLGLGLDIKLGGRLSAAIEYNLRMVSSDYLDNIGRMGRRPANDVLHHFHMAIFLNLGSPSPLDQ